MAKALVGKRTYGSMRDSRCRRWCASGLSWLLVAVFLLMPGSVVMARPGPSDPVEPKGYGANSETVARLAIGDGSEAVGIERPEEGGEWGPSSFDIGPDGRFFVLDGVNGRVHVLSASGEYERDIDFPEGVLCPTDVRVTDKGLYLLDLPLQPAAVHHVGYDGCLIDSWTVPEAYVDDCVTGMRVVERSGAGAGAGAQPSVWLQIQNAWEVPLMVAGKRTSVRRVPLQRNDDVVDIPSSSRREHAVGNRRNARRFGVSKDWESWQSGQVTAYRSGVPSARMSITSAAQIGAIWFEDCDAEGNAYVYAEEIGQSGTNAFVKVFDANGEPVAQCRIPFERYRTFPQQSVRVTDDGDVLALVPGATGVEIVRLGQEVRQTSDLSSETLATHDVDPIESTGPQRATGLASALAALFGLEEAYGIWDRFDAYDRAMEYCYNSWYCNRYNYYPNGVNVRPRYITTYNRRWQSVPYCWGGWDTKSTFNSAMSANKDAGDINTWSGGKKSWTAGADCSGLVTRLWGIGSKQNTYSLASTSFSYYIGVPGRARERLGDIYVKPGSHVMMVDYVTLGGARVFESTKWYSYDRVVHPIRAWAGIPGYYARRYNNWWK